MGQPQPKRRLKISVFNFVNTTILLPLKKCDNIFSTLPKNVAEITQYLTKILFPIQYLFIEVTWDILDIRCTL